MSIRFIFCLVLLITQSGRALAWGKQGHAIIAQIAKSQVSEATAEKVAYYLKGLSWEDMANWMDDMKPTLNAEYMHDWHFAYLPKDKTYVKSKSPDIVSQLDYHLRILRNRGLFSQDAIHEVLKVIFHLVGDICQPFHCGYPNDQGAALVPVTYNGAATTLHNLWDVDLIRDQKIDMWLCSKTAMELETTEKKDIQVIEPKVWYNDSRGCLEAAYAFTNNDIDAQYATRSSEIIRKQLVKAGFRLAAVLESAFK